MFRSFWIIFRELIGSSLKSLNLKVFKNCMFMVWCIFIYEDHVSNQRETTFYALY
jgi:hypothetical protein